MTPSGPGLMHRVLPIFWLMPNVSWMWPQSARMGWCFSMNFL